MSEFESNVSRLFIKPADRQGRILHAAVGIAGEAGEILDGVKKSWIYGKPEDAANILEECGDALFYIVALLQQYGFTLADAQAANVAKLQKRYPDGYSDADAITRKDKIDEVR